jgi:phage terminase small subunit
VASELINPALTDRQAKFVAEYLQDLNATQAAIRAGYAKRSAEQTAYALLRHPQISSVLQQRQREQLAWLDIKAVNVLEGLRRIAFADIGQAFDPSTGQMRHIADLPDEFRTAIASVEVDTDGLITKVRLKDGLAALNALAKHLGILQPETEPTLAPANLTQVNVTRCIWTG